MLKIVKTNDIYLFLESTIDTLFGKEFITNRLNTFIHNIYFDYLLNVHNEYMTFLILSHLNSGYSTLAKTHSE